MVLFIWGNMSKSYQEWPISSVLFNVACCIIRNSENKSGITMEKAEYKDLFYVVNIVCFIDRPEISIPLFICMCFVSYTVIL